MDNKCIQFKYESQVKPLEDAATLERARQKLGVEGARVGATQTATTTRANIANAQLIERVNEFRQKQWLNENKLKIDAAKQNRPLAEQLKIRLL